MEFTVSGKTFTGVTFATDGAGDITEMRVGVSVNVEYNDGDSGSVSTSIDVWPLLTEGQRQQMGLIKTVVDQAVTDL